MPGLVLVCHSSGSYHLLTFRTSRGKLLLVTRSTEDVVVLRNEGFRADCHLTMCTAETFVVPLFSFVFHLFHSCSENLIASVTSCREGLVVAVGAEDPIIFTAERHVDQRDLAHTTQETVLVPMLVFVGEVL